MNKIYFSLICGLWATFANTVFDIILPPRTAQEGSPLVTFLQKVQMYLFGHSIEDPNHSILLLSHFAFGILMGLVYFILKKHFQKITRGEGVFFCISFWLLADEILLPLLNLSPSILNMGLWEQTNELVSHVIYGYFLHKLTLCKKENYCGKLSR